MLSDKLVEEIKDSRYYKEFEEYLISKIYELDTVDGMNKLSNEQAGEESRVREKSIMMLESILSPFVRNAKKIEYTKEQIRDAEKRRGL